MFIYVFSYMLPFTGYAQAAASGLPGWAVVLIVLAVILVVALLMIWNASLTPEAKLATAGHGSETVADDLKLIEGIGPKIASLLQMAGISTFAQLAGAEPAQLERILNDSGLYIADPSTWPDQARLAAAHNWDELARLQTDLKGGRKV